MGVSLHLAGGCVRDLLLRRSVLDLDLVVEGNASLFARRLARELQARARMHPRFRTATLELPGGGRLDVAGTRSERYLSAGALPEVARGGIAEDLARRDFTVNAMALRIAPRPRRLLDPHGGRHDLGRRVLRMLHPTSPFDDPTRAFRAVRYSSRLGFAIERQTRSWVRKAAAAGALAAVSGDRLRRELMLILTEPNRARAVGALEDLGLAAAIHPALPRGAATRVRLRRAERLAAREASEPTWLLYLLVWAADLEAGEATELARRLNLPRGQRRRLEQWPALRHAFARAAPVSGEVARDELLALAACLPAASRSSAGPMRLRGRDLVGAGVPPGPAIGRALAATRSARGSGRILPEQELEFALRAAREGPA